MRFLRASTIYTLLAVVGAAAPFPQEDAEPASNVSARITRGVNLGGWLVLEKWMVPEVFQGPFSSAIDQYTFDQIPGSLEALEKHWSTFITEQDIATIASWGINTLRVPIGYWAYNHTVKAPYHAGADRYLEKTMTWARTYKLKVLIDMHGVPGSQNGFDNSGQTGRALWQQGDNMNQTVNVWQQIVAKYGTKQWADVLWGIDLVNEPISWSDTVDPQKTHDWAKSTFKTLTRGRQPSYKIAMSDAFQTPKAWVEDGKELNANFSSPPFWIDTHFYQNQVANDSTLTQEQHIEKACNYATTDLIPDVPEVPVIVGEFTAQTNVCIFPNGTNRPGTNCRITGCQCSVDDMDTWDQPLIDLTAKFLDAELDTYETKARGWIIWSYKAPGAWGLNNLVQYGVFGKDVAKRRFPGQCDKIWARRARRARLSHA